MLTKHYPNLLYYYLNVTLMLRNRKRSIMKTFFLLTVGYVLSISFTQGQEHLTFHSDYEKHVIEAFLNNENASPLDLQLIADAQLTSEMTDVSKALYNDIIKDLRQKQERITSNERFLSWMFYKVHRKYLKQYSPYSSLAETLLTGNYDCLSASSLYALLLQDLGYDSEVIETTYHVYLKIKTPAANYLIESTDPISGFIANDHEIESRLNSFEDEPQYLASLKDTYVFQFNLNTTVSLTSLAGLQYYNEAVSSYNNKELLKTIDLLEKSAVFYHSSRITEFGLVLANALNLDESLDKFSKDKCLNRIGRFLEPTKSFASR